MWRGWGGGVERERLGQCVRKEEPKIMLSYKVEWHVTGFTFRLSDGISCDEVQLSAFCVSGLFVCVCSLLFCFSISLLLKSHRSKVYKFLYYSGMLETL